MDRWIMLTDPIPRWNANSPSRYLEVTSKHRCSGMMKQQNNACSFSETNQPMRIFSSHSPIANWLQFFVKPRGEIRICFKWFLSKRSNYEHYNSPSSLPQTSWFSAYLVWWRVRMFFWNDSCVKFNGSIMQIYSFCATPLPFLHFRSYLPRTFSLQCLLGQKWLAYCSVTFYFAR